MKTYSIINGTSLYIVTCTDLDHVREKVEAICDFSKEVIVREITTLDIFAKLNVPSKI